MEGIKVIDNFLDTESFEFLKETIMGAGFPWFFTDYNSMPGDNEYQYTHPFYEQGEFLGHFREIICPILNLLNIGAIRRIKANTTFKKVEVNNYLFHRDFHDNLEGCKTAVFYVNSNDGKTVFENGEEVESVENRIAIFPSEMLHAATTHTDTDRRVVINFNWY